MKDKTQLWLDIGILIAIILAIYYLKIQGSGESFNPFDGFMAMIRMGGN